MRNYPHLAELAQGLRPLMKDSLNATFLGYHSETAAFERLLASQVPIVRGAEFAGVDGAIVCSYTPVSMIPLSASFADKWIWATKQTTVEFISFDMKRLGLLPKGRKQLDYSFSQPHPENFTKDAEVYFVSFEGDMEHIAIVPKVVYEGASDISYGTTPLISRVATWAQPYMVHLDQLDEAYRNLTNKTSDYTNPSNLVTLTGWRPKRTTSPPLRPTSPSHETSLTAMMNLRDRCVATSPDVAFDFNPLSPYIGDFLIRFTGSPQPLIVEHKILRGLGFHFEIGNRSAFAKNRMWHFLICQDGTSASRFLCLARHEVRDEWEHQLSPNIGLDQLQMSLYEGPDGVRAMLDNIRQKSARAVQTAKNILQGIKPHELDIEALISSSKVQDVMERLAGEKAAEAQSEADAASRGKSLGDQRHSESEPGQSAMSPFRQDGGRLYHSFGLHWVCDELNGHCRANGAMVCFPLDIGHPLGTHLLVDYDWTREDKAAFDLDRSLPVSVYSRRIRDSTAIVLRFVDFSGNSTTKGFPLSMRGTYWTRPAMLQHFIIIACHHKPSMMFKSGQSYLLYPSEFTTQFDQGCRQPCTTGHQGELYYRRVEQASDRLPAPKFSNLRTEVQRFEVGSPFVKASGADPLRCLLSMRDGSIFRNLFQVMRGEGSMYISNPQSRLRNPPFSKELHRTTVASVHQAGWNFGLRRQQGHLASVG